MNVAQTFGCNSNLHAEQTDMLHTAHRHAKRTETIQRWKRRCRFPYNHAHNMLPPDLAIHLLLAFNAHLLSSIQPPGTGFSTPPFVSPHRSTTSTSPQANGSHVTAPLGHDTSPQYPHCSFRPAAYPHYPSAAPRIHLRHVRTLTETPTRRHRIPPALLPSRCGFLSNFIRLSIKGRTGTYINSLDFLGSRLYFTRSLNNSTKLA